ncbi:hypothetical protein VNO77_20951 [Canavalia gladiata]|uniref:S-protein homolog n=1 Tax=Canavalia gladiata TaxID=3824 RepID=A0AAN9LUK2_CANGL
MKRCNVWICKKYFHTMDAYVVVVVVTAHIKVTNSLAAIANLDLTVYCKTDRRSHVLRHGTNYEFNYDNSLPKPFTCFFLWDGAHHMFDNCQRCDWFVKQSGPCRNKGCFNWKS